jgi:hypothetical protein
MQVPRPSFLEGREAGESAAVIIRVPENPSSVVVKARLAFNSVLQCELFHPPFGTASA